MGLDAIESSALRALDAGRLSDAPRAGKNPALQQPEPPLNAAGTLEKSVERGVPSRLAIQQQLPPNTRLRVDEASKQIVAQILDENNEVIRQIPPEALLELSERFNRLEGLLFNRKS